MRPPNISSRPTTTPVNSCFGQLGPPGNVVLSPYSIGTAMAMAFVGARGENAAEMAKVLSLTLTAEEVNAANVAALAKSGRTSSASFQLHIANALMLTQQGGVIADDYVALLREKYSAERFAAPTSQR